MSLCTDICPCECFPKVIYRGTTPVFYFNLAFDTQFTDKPNTHVIFSSGTNVVDKSGKDIIYYDNDNKISVKLSQYDTLSFVGDVVNIQILATMSSGFKPASDIITIPVEDSLRGDVGW